jgi:murein DD-endopeptidase MepM/ murein hydrolase activator NlpD
VNRLREAGAFLAGFLMGALTLYAWLLGKGQLAREPSFVSTPAPAPPSTLAATPSIIPLGSLAPSPSPFSAASAPSGFEAAPAPWAPQAEAPMAVPDVPAPPQALAAPPPDLGDFARLKARDIAIPVRGVDARQIRDNFTEMRGGHVHEAIDIPAPRGTPVLAVDDGIVRKLFTSAQGGLTVYEFDRAGAYCYYYAHLDRYADGLEEGMALKKGDVIGYVGTTGNAPPGTPHLHFTIFKLGPAKQWWKGTALNPFPLWALPKVSNSG